MNLLSQAFSRVIFKIWHSPRNSSWGAYFSVVPMDLFFHHFGDFFPYRASPKMKYEFDLADRPLHLADRSKVENWRPPLPNPYGGMNITEKQASDAWYSPHYALRGQPSTTTQPEPTTTQDGWDPLEDTEWGDYDSFESYSYPWAQGNRSTSWAGPHAVPIRLDRRIT